jgi:hypothetical protein
LPSFAEGRQNLEKLFPKDAICGVTIPDERGILLIDDPAFHTTPGATSAERIDDEA